MTHVFRATYASGVTLTFRAAHKPDAYAHASVVGKAHGVGEPAYVEKLYGHQAAHAELGTFVYGA